MLFRGLECRSGREGLSNDDRGLQRLAARITPMGMVKPHGSSRTSKAARVPGLDSRSSWRSIATFGGRLHALHPLATVEGEGESLEHLWLEACGLQHPHPLRALVVADVRGVAEELDGVEERVESGGFGCNGVRDKEDAARLEDAIRLGEGPCEVGVVMGADAAGDHVH